MMRKIAFIFPGQGSQSVGMGFSMAKRFEDFRKIYETYLQRADQVLNMPISKWMEKGPAEKLKLTEITQPALLICSSAMSEWLAQNGIRASYGLGHSLGEYSALVAAGSLQFEEALKLVHLRGRLMSEAVPAGEGGMAALVGATDEEAQRLCAEISKNGKVLEPSVFNCSGQVVVSGHATALEEAEKRASEFGVRRFARLEVSGPFHCSLLKPAGERLSPALQAAEVLAPQIRIIANVTAKPVQTPEEIRQSLIEQVYRPVLWAESVRFVGDEGVEEFVEVGAGKVLTGLIRKILPDAKCTPLDGLQKLELLAA